MKNDTDHPVMPSGRPGEKTENSLVAPVAQNGAIGRREFLRSAARAGLAVTSVKAAPAERKITARTSIRVGLIGSDGHGELLLGSIPKLSGILGHPLGGGRGRDSSCRLPPAQIRTCAP